jgi:predicted glycoside hydrolase/deacetylase ChbG (UPF0249 family)
MKYLVVNADDLGASPGVNRGIVEAHDRGIVTSTSLDVTTPWSAEAAALARARPDLDVGLHVNLGGWARDWVIDPDDHECCRAELSDQIGRFEELMGRRPTHLDSHRNVHRDPRLLPDFLQLAERHRLPLRQHSAARYFSEFYGRWDGEAHPEQVSIDNLLRMLRMEIGDGITELSCHPGYVDSDLRSGYTAEREVELRTLCAPAIRAALRELHIQLIGFRDLTRATRASWPPGR